MSTARTLEQRVRFDHGLTIGTHLVEFFMGDKSVRALVEIAPRGVTRYLKYPEATSMYSSWRRMKGDTCKADGPVLVWAARSEAFRQQYADKFTGEPVARLEVFSPEATS